jgi:adenine phosphoribosyltransferase
MQADAISPGQTVVIIDDVIATGAYYYLNTINLQHDGFFDNRLFSLALALALAIFPRFAGGSAAATGELVEKQGGKLLQYLFIVEVTPLGGQSKLKAPVYSILQLDE